MPRYTPRDRKARLESIITMLAAERQHLTVVEKDIDEEADMLQRVGVQHKTDRLDQLVYTHNALLEIGDEFDALIDALKHVTLKHG